MGSTTAGANSIETYVPEEAAMGVEIDFPMHEEDDDDNDDDGKEEEAEDWDDWDAEDDGGSETTCVCLFCEATYSSSEELFLHCRKDHSFDFRNVRKELGLDFYGSFKLINYVRAQVAKNKCWTWGSVACREQMSKDGRFPWEDDVYLKPFMQDDVLLHCFVDDEMDEDEGTTAPIDQEELVELMDAIDTNDCADKDGSKRGIAVSEVPDAPNNSREDSTRMEESLGAPHHHLENGQLKGLLGKVASRERRIINENYFGAYGTYSIHREMISDKVRMDAYRGAILDNPSLMNQARVLDVGCGTGILSLFAAQAGASKVIAVEGSKNMSSMAKKILKDNEMLSDVGSSGVIEVVHCMIEELDSVVNIPSHSIDVLVSEWMGYCLLFETMLTSVLYARDRWLKPGGAILPDTSTIFAAGFGKGGTSIPFWENVYGFDMSCIGKEVLEDAAKFPIVDVMDSDNIVTDTSVVQTFDLATMKPEEVDFTATFELQVKPDVSGNTSKGTSGVVWCYGIVLWFETGFTGRFCKEMPTVLSTSPYTQKTHWAQTILTLREPIALTSSCNIFDKHADVGSERNPGARIGSRISIVRAAVHRSIDISLEITAIGMDGRKHNYPVQIFNME